MTSKIKMVKALWQSKHFFLFPSKLCDRGGSKRYKIFAEVICERPWKCVSVLKNFQVIFFSPPFYSIVMSCMNWKFIVDVNWENYAQWIFQHWWTFSFNFYKVFPFFSLSRSLPFIITYCVCAFNSAHVAAFSDNILLFFYSLLLLFKVIGHSTLLWLCNFFFFFVHCLDWICDFVFVSGTCLWLFIVDFFFLTFAEFIVSK